jgi:hypothetical protein
MQSQFKAESGNNYNFLGTGNGTGNVNSNEERIRMEILNLEKKEMEKEVSGGSGSGNGSGSGSGPGSTPGSGSGSGDSNDNNGTASDVLLNKLSTMDINNSWNDKNERLIVSIGENSAGYKWMHEKNAQMYNIISMTLGLTLIILNTGLSAQTLIPNSLTILQDIIIYIVTLISVVKNFLKHEELAAKHNSVASKFGELYHRIQQQMVLYRKDRQNALEFIKTSLKTYDDLIVNGPEISPIIQNKFKKLFSSSQISLPEVADRIQRIEITTEIPGTHRSAGGNWGASKSNGPIVMSRGLTKNLFCIENDITDEDLTN